MPASAGVPGPGEDDERSKPLQVPGPRRVRCGYTTGVGASYGQVLDERCRETSRSR